MKNATLHRLVRAHKAMGHPARLRILAMLRDGELCVCQITAALGLAASTVSAHLRELRIAGLTTERKVGRWVHVGPAPDGDESQLVLQTLAGLADDPQLAADAQLVEELRTLSVEDLCRLGLEAARSRCRTTTRGRER